MASSISCSSAPARGGAGVEAPAETGRVEDFRRGAETAVTELVDTITTGVVDATTANDGAVDATTPTEGDVDVTVATSGVVDATTVTGAVVGASTVPDGVVDVGSVATVPGGVVDTTPDVGSVVDATTVPDGVVDVSTITGGVVDTGCVIVATTVTGCAVGGEVEVNCEEMWEELVANPSVLLTAEIPWLVIVMLVYPAAVEDCNTTAGGKAGPVAGAECSNPLRTVPETKKCCERAPAAVETYSLSLSQC